MFTARIQVTLRPSILDPQGKAVEHAIASLGVPSVNNVRIGKYIVLSVDEPSEDNARAATEEICQRLLANPVMEDYSFELERA